MQMYIRMPQLKLVQENMDIFEVFLKMAIKTTAFKYFILTKETIKPLTKTLNRRYCLGLKIPILTHTM